MVLLVCLVDLFVCVRLLVLGEALRFVGDRRLYQVLFLRDDAARSVHVDEVSVVDFDVVRMHLERGESVFITQTQSGGFARPRNGMHARTADVEGARQFSRRNAVNPWFFVHT